MPLTGLTPEQFAAATAPPSPTIIVAGPGSGKTRTIVARARHYSQVIDPRRILLVTFTNKAAREAGERLTSYGAAGFHTSTFHSLCAQNLLARTKFSIADEDAAKSIIKEAIEMGGLGLDPGRVRDWISCERNKGFTLTEPPPQAVDEFMEIWKQYELLKQHYRLYDFDDLLTEFTNTGIVDEVAQFFQMVLVDETQDTNEPQIGIVRRLAAPHLNVTMVGDVDQCVALDTPVSTANGILEARHVESGTPVLSAGRWRVASSSVRGVHRTRDEAIRVTLEDGRQLVCSPTHQMFVRQPRREDDSQFLIYLMESEDGRWRVGKTGVARSRGKGGENGLLIRLKEARGERAWVIATAKSDVEARVKEAALSLRYGIPSVCFYAQRQEHQRFIDGVFLATTGPDGARRLLSDMRYEKPHVRKSLGHVGRPWLTLTMNCNYGANKTGHRVSFDGWATGLDEVLVRDGRVADLMHNVKRTSGRPRANHYFTVTRASFADALEVFRECRSVLGDRAQYRQQAFFSDGERYDVLPASSLYPGAIVPVVSDDDEVQGVAVASVVWEKERELVDIEVPACGNFIANGIVTHNSIYGWRGAQPANLEKFRDEFGAQVFELTYNHRSTSRIVDFSRKVIDQYPAPMRTSALQSTRPEGHHPSVYVYYDNEAEARAISTWCRDLMNQGVPAREIAVLFRTNAQTQPVEEAFTESRLGYTVVGAMSFYDRKEVRDALSFVRVLVNDMDVPSFRRSLLCVPGVGDSSVRDLVGIMNQESCGPLAAIARYCSGKSGDRAEMLQRYADAMYQMQQMRPEEGIKLAADEFLTAKYASDQRAQDRMENVEALYNVAAKFATASQFITSVSLVSSSDEEHQGVCLATCHAVKGLEFSAVWVAGVEDGLFPHVKADSDEEENRLLYVACTRAKDILALSWCRMRKHWGKTSTTDPSPYLVAMGAAK